MALKSNLRDLPAKVAPPPEPPDAPDFGLAVEGWLKARRAREGPREMATVAARVRHSWAGMCSRRIAEELAAVAAGEEEPPELDSGALWNFAVGQAIHDIIQAALLEVFGAACAVEVTVGEGNYAGHIDAVVTRNLASAPGTAEVVWRSSIEIKSVNGTKFKEHLNTGPDWPARLQAALNAAAVDADEAVVIDLAKENLGPSYAARLLGDGYLPVQRWWSEWHYDRDIYEAWAAAETKRLDRILHYVDMGFEVPRHIPMAMPPGARVVDPWRGRWELFHVPPGEETGSVIDTGTVWQCGYCDRRPACMGQPDQQEDQ